MLLALEKLPLHPGFSYVHHILPFPYKCVDDFGSKLRLPRQG